MSSELKCQFIDVEGNPHIIRSFIYEIVQFFFSFFFRPERSDQYIVKLRLLKDMNTIFDTYLTNG